MNTDMTADQAAAILDRLLSSVQTTRDGHVALQNALQRLIELARKGEEISNGKPA
jgi:hypothetical protein